MDDEDDNDDRPEPPETDDGDDDRDDQTRMRMTTRTTTTPRRRGRAPDKEKAPDLRRGQALYSSVIPGLQRPLPMRKESSAAAARRAGRIFSPDICVRDALRRAEGAHRGHAFPVKSRSGTATQRRPISHSSSSRA
jgi:hypothetical protein